MPGTDDELEALARGALTARLAAMLVEATDRLERQAAEPERIGAEALARGVGVIARSGAALAACVERLRRARSQPGGTDATEEADMDDADTTGAARPAPDGAHDVRRWGDPERLERRLRTLARNLRIPGGDAGGAGGAAGGGLPGDRGGLVGGGARPPAPA